MANEDPDKSIRRRDFFRRGILELFKHADKALDPVKRVAQQFDALDRGIGAGAAAAASTSSYSGSSYASPSMPVSPGPWSAYSTEPVYVRPPGAQPEALFVGACCRSQQCVNVCPVQAIKIDYSGIFMNGNPYIDIDSQPCVMCQDILCTRNCPSGALQFTEATAVKLGTAIWNESLCKRTTGDDCQLCVDKCPVGKTAIEFDERRVVVHGDGCTGCGVCQNACPTWPKAIKVCPRDESPGSYGA